MGRRRAFRAARSVPEWASATESRSLTTITGANYQANQMYEYNGLELAQFNARITQIAQAYQHYRIRKVTLEFKPQQDTFVPLAGAPGTGINVPALYYMINKSGSIPPNPTAENLKQMGAKPIRFDDKVIKVSWRPSVLNDANSGLNLGVGTQYKVSPWLSTSANPLAPGVWIPSQVNHLGIYFQVDRTGLLPAGYAELQYDVQVTIDVQFKKPLVKVNSQAPPAITCVPRALDAELLPRT